MELNLVAPINKLGYGYASLNILEALTELNVKVSLFPIGPIDADWEYKDLIQSSLTNASFFNKNAPCLRIWHQNDMSFFVGKGKHIGFPFFELDTLNVLERHHLNSCDKVFVASNWAKVILEQNEITSEISVVPLGVNTDIFFPTNKNMNRSTTVFLNIGKWETRKGHDILVHLFDKAFNEDDDVELWMLCNNPFNSQEEDFNWYTRYKQSKLSDKIRILPRLESSKDVADLINKADCGIFPSRAEGWNLDLLEVMACGKHVITTNYSAHTAFCDIQNSFLVWGETTQNNKIRLEEAYDGKWFSGQGKWLYISEAMKEEFIHHMKAIHSMKKNKILQPNIYGENTGKTFNWTNTAKQILSNI